MFKLTNDNQRPGVRVLNRVEKIETVKDNGVVEMEVLIPQVCPYRAAFVTILENPLTHAQQPVLNEFYCATNCPHFTFVEEADDPVTGETDGSLAVNTCKRLIILDDDKQK